MRYGGRLEIKDTAGVLINSGSPMEKHASRPHPGRGVSGGDRLPASEAPLHSTPDEMSARLRILPVSYTHLDVYKRQDLPRAQTVAELLHPVKPTPGLPGAPVRSAWTAEGGRPYAIWVQQRLNRFKEHQRDQDLEPQGTQRYTEESKISNAMRWEIYARCSAGGFLVGRRPRGPLRAALCE